MSVDLSAFHRTFFEESYEGLALMESSLLGLHEGTPDPEIVNAVFRAAHSIKGGAATFGLSAIAQFTHTIETLLDEMRDGRRAPDRALVDVLLSGVDILGLLLKSAEVGQTADASLVDPVREALDAMAAQPATKAVVSETAALVNADAAFDIDFRPHPELFASGNDPYRLLRELQALGTCTVEANLDALPALHDLDPEQAFMAWHIRVHGPGLTEAAIAEVFDWVTGECDLVIASHSTSHAVTAPVQATTQVAPAGPAANLAPAAARSGTAAAKPVAADGSIRVKTEKIDALINLVGELVITQSMLSELGQHFDMSRLEDLRAGLAQLERNSRELQENVIGIRMVPIGLAFNRFPRMVHDVSRQLGKDVQLRLSGEQTELDKTVIEKIGDPLVHLVRNALDHGIEAPDERLAKGKPAQGRLTLNAFHRGGEILIEVSDDGAGLDVARIRQKAEERGLIVVGAPLSHERLQDLIFEPGFSTAKVVSDLSGRGVGMDVVRRNIKELGGAIDVRSTPGRGATFTIRLPLTLAILDGQLLRIGDRTFVAPLVSMIETVRVKPELVGRVAGATELYRLRDEYLPVLHPRALFNLPGAEPPLEQSLLMIVEAEGRRAGVLVDELTAQQQVVIKSLESNFRRVPGLSGATILGDGTVALILDIAGLLALGLEHGALADRAA